MNCEDVRDADIDVRMAVSGARNACVIARIEVQESVDVMRSGKTHGLDGPEAEWSTRNRMVGEGAKCAFCVGCGAA